MEVSKIDQHSNHKSKNYDQDRNTRKGILHFLVKHKQFLVILLFTLSWTIGLFFVSPQEIVSTIGLEAGYLMIFVTAFIGVSGLASAPFYATLVTFASTGEFNIFLLILAAAPARAFGDSVFFFLGHRGHSALSEFFDRHLKRFSHWLNNKPKWTVPFFAYLYTSISPLPQDILMVTLGLGRVKFFWIFTAVLLGNATFIAIVNYFSIYLFG